MMTDEWQSTQSTNDEPEPSPIDEENISDDSRAENVIFDAGQTTSEESKLPEETTTKKVEKVNSFFK